MTAFDLTSVELFASLPAADIARLQESLDERTLAPGEILFSEGDKPDNAYIVAAGEVEILKAEDDREARIALSGPGIVVGEMALLTDDVRNATARAHTDVTLIVIPKATFDDIVNSNTAAMRAVFDVFIRRSREQELRVRRSERMAQIGVLTAGLAHEMNNPAAAIVRGAEQLQPLLARFEESLARLPDDIDLGLLDRELPKLTALDRADREAAVEAELTKRGVTHAWNIAPALVAAGLTPTDLENMAETADLSLLADALAARSEIASLIAEVHEGARRLAELVGALKSYSFLDRGPVQKTDVVKGIEDTLLILKSKLKEIAIIREYQPELPSITAYGSLLNQVWTNLIDNAADAIHSSGIDNGTITLRAGRDGEHVVVEVEDNGPGIPDDVVGHVFEAFYTTKAPGSGTGIGLNTVYGIIVNDHKGTIDVTSEPGSTVFRVRLPIAQD